MKVLNSFRHGVLRKIVFNLLQCASKLSGLCRNASGRNAASEHLFFFACHFCTCYLFAGIRHSVDVLPQIILLVTFRHKICSCYGNNGDANVGVRFWTHNSKKRRFCTCLRSVAVSSPPTKKLCLGVCKFVSRITQKVTNGFRRIFFGCLGHGQRGKWLDFCGNADLKTSLFWIIVEDVSYHEELAAALSASYSRGGVLRSLIASCCLQGCAVAGRLKSVHDSTQVDRGVAVLFRHALSPVLRVRRPVRPSVPASPRLDGRQRQLRRITSLSVVP